MTPGLEHPEKRAFETPGAGVPAPQPEGAGIPPEEQLRWMRIARRLNEAAGYLELGLPGKTLEILDELGDVGPFAPGAALLRGEALRLQERYAEAAASFEYAARFMPPPFDRPAYLASSACYRQVGDINRAINLLGFARGALPPYKRIILQRMNRMRDLPPPAAPESDAPAGPQPPVN